MPAAAQAVWNAGLVALRELGFGGGLGFVGVVFSAFWLPAYTGFGSSLVAVAGLTLLLSRGFPARSAVGIAP